MGSSSEDDGNLVVKEEHMGEDMMDEDMDPWDDHPRRSAFSPYRVYNMVLVSSLFIFVKGVLDLHKFFL